MAVTVCPSLMAHHLMWSRALMVAAVGASLAVATARTSTPTAEPSVVVAKDIQLFGQHTDLDSGDDAADMTVTSPTGVPTAAKEQGGVVPSPSIVRRRNPSSLPSVLWDSSSEVLPPRAAGMAEHAARAGSTEWLAIAQGGPKHHS